MKLRNKKTGEIWTLTNRNEGTSAVLWVSNGSQTHVIESIEELANNFEDYEDPEEVALEEMIKKLERDFEISRDVWNNIEKAKRIKKVIEKLEAWKRLKVKGLRWSDKVRYESLCGNGFYITITACMTPEYYIDKETKDDLELLFGGEE